jgi:hypothetical protein
MDEKSIQPKHVFMFVVLAFLVSKSWMPLNLGSFTGDPSRWPDQVYSMNMGPWMSGVGYGIQMAVVLAVLFTVYQWHSRRNGMARIIQMKTAFVGWLRRLTSKKVGTRRVGSARHATTS